jgi:hypothetical protein
VFRGPVQHDGPVSLRYCAQVEAQVLVENEIDVVRQSVALVLSVDVRDQSVDAGQVLFDEKLLTPFLQLFYL